MLVRLNAAVAATTPAAGFEPAEFRNRYGLEGVPAAAEFCENLALDGGVPPTVRDQVAALSGSPDEVVVRTLRVLLASPEYQMA